MKYSIPSAHISKHRPLLKTSKVGDLLTSISHLLRNISDTPRVEAELLLANILKKNRLWLYTHPEAEISHNDLNSLTKHVIRRMNHEPLAYILGEKYFWKYKFTVNKDTLIPRPETELIVEEAISWHKKLKTTAPRILDLGTGSGNIAITLAKEIKSALIYALDISKEAIKTAKHNADVLNVSTVNFIVSNWFDSIDNNATFDIIVSNPPYITSEEMNVLSEDIKNFEPKRALTGGADGLVPLRKIISQINTHLKKPGIFLAEIGAAQGPTAKEIAIQHLGPSYQIDIVKDLSGLSRLLKVIS